MKQIIIDKLIKDPRYLTGISNYYNRKTGANKFSICEIVADIVVDNFDLTEKMK